MDASTTLLRESIDHGTASPSVGYARQGRRSFAALKPYFGFLAVVVLPTLIAAIYLFGVAARQYESEAHFVVKTASQANGGSSSGLAQAFGITGALNPSQSESFDVGDYLSSHDALATLRRRFDLVAMFRPPEADLLTRLQSNHPAAEQLLKYYRRQVRVVYSPDTGITTLRVRAFRPADAQAIAETLLEMGEQRVNILNERALENAVGVAERQLKEAEGVVSAGEGGMTNFRQTARDLDPERTGAANITMLSELRAELAQARAQLAAMGASIRPDSPQYTALSQRIQALQTQIETETGKLAGQPGANARNMGAFESLRLRQDFASKRYESAAAALQSARVEALKQQLYIVRIVEPNRPEKALYPQRWLTLASVFFAVLLAYGIGSLILAGIREHAA